MLMLYYSENRMLILDDYTVQQTGKHHLDLTFELYVTAEQLDNVLKIH